ncbi:hypothetical protein I7I53_00972 [Histoplasma capsulatum var. duboisii H88]|uniref:Uncharacterized protein n=1 Tax=Ajellomyces capsulatus (strain H88) TaxID=544711 RepID=A0A8A1LMJ5_AJEC8|nr:hypothetical protein I7I53_00972 [Histoplasma capsulatum var. duboisii H88]
MCGALVHDRQLRVNKIKPDALRRLQTMPRHCGCYMTTLRKNAQLIYMLQAAKTLDQFMAVILSLLSHLTEILGIFLRISL